MKKRQRKKRNKKIWNSLNPGDTFVITEKVENKTFYHVNMVLTPEEMKRAIKVTTFKCEY